MEKVDLVPSQDETINEIIFSDLFKLEDIQRIQDLFAESTGVASIITQPDGTPITRPSNFCRLCKDIIRKTESGLQHCFKSDSIIGLQNPSGPTIRSCLGGGLWEAGASISIGGRQLANWVIGQVKNGEVNEEQMMKFADEIGADRNDFITALAEVPVMSKEMFEKMAVMLHAIVNELSTKASEHYQLEQHVFKLKQSESKLLEKIGKALKSSDAMLSAFMEYIPSLILIKDHELRPVFANKKFHDHFPISSWMGKKPHELFPSAIADEMVEKDTEALNTGYTSYEETWKDMDGVSHIYFTEKFRIDIPDSAPLLGSIITDVTEKKRSEYAILENGERHRLLAESLRISEQRSRALIENAPDGIVMINKEDRFIYASPPACRMFGFEMDEIGKHPPSELTHPEDLPMVYETLGKLIQNPGLVPTIQYRIRHKEGHWRWIESTFSNLLDTPGIEAIVINFRDITDRKIAEDKIRENELRFRKLSTGLEQSPGAVVITDTKGLIEYVNPKFTYFSGYTLDMVQGKVARILKPGRTTDEIHDQIWQSIISGKEWTGEYLSKKLNGETYWESVTVAPIHDPGGNMTNIIITMEDISERKRMINELVDARKKAEQSDRLKSAFLANMSHEIRTPMNAIVGFAEMLSDTDLTSADRTQFSAIIQSRSDDLMHIINDLLEISRIESGNFTVVKTEFIINKVFDDLDMVFRKRLHQINKAHLSFEIEKALPDHQSAIYTDSYIFKQVFSNLIENAIKYTHTGSIRFGYNQPDNGFITFYVKDTGIGISTENQNVIFEHFRQAEIENQHRYSGTGLGLAICRGSLTHLNGRIWVVSEPGKGSTFYFTLPFNNPGLSTERNNLQSGLVIQQSVPVIKHTWAGKRLLIVEDEPTNMEFLRIILRRTKVEITSAESGTLLRKHYDNLDHFDLVLLDVRLPDANGWDLAREIKTIRPELPIIAQTAYAMSDDFQKSKQAGCDNYISKPINKEKLLVLISKYLKES